MIRKLLISLEVKFWLNNERWPAHFSLVGKTFPPAFEPARPNVSAPRSSPKRPRATVSTFFWNKSTTWVLTLIALGLLRGAVHLSTLVRTAQKLTQAQRRQLRLPRKKGTRFHSVPCSDVFRRVWHGIDRQRLAGSLTRWLQSQAGELPRTLAIDGKTIRDHLGLIVARIDTEEGTPVALAANVKGKGHELKTTQALLASPEVNLLNATVTADSLHGQDETAHLITREKGGDYLLQVRDNQPTLRALAERQLEQAHPLFLPPTASTDASSCASSTA